MARSARLANNGVSEVIARRSQTAVRGEVSAPWGLHYINWRFAARSPRALQLVAVIIEE